MSEFGGIFASSSAMSVYLIGSAVCIGLNVLFAIWLLVTAAKPAAADVHPTSRLKLVAATTGATLFLLIGVGAAISLVASHRHAVAVSAPAATISIDDLHRHIDMKTLPVTDVSDYM